MATPVLTINAATKIYVGGTLNISERITGRNTISFRLISSDGSYRPTIFHEIILTLNSIRIFGGIILEHEETGIGSETGVGLEFQISGVDFTALADRMYTEFGFAPVSQTLKLTLIALAPYYSGYGVTLSGSQVDGPVLPALRYDNQLLSDVLTNLCAVATPLVSPAQAVTWEIDYNKVLSAYGVLDSAKNAPFNITTANIIGPVKVRPSKADYANHVIVEYGTGIKDIIDNIGPGNGVITTFALNYPMYGAEFVNVGGTVVDGVIVGGVYETLGHTGSGATWIINVPNQTLTRTSAPGAVSILVPMQVSFPLTVTADGGASAADLIQRKYPYPEVFDKTVAQGLANSLLIQAMAAVQEVEYTTLTAGLHPGQNQTITLPKHGISGAHLITEVTIRDYMESQLTYDVKAIGGTSTIPEGWMSTYQLWMKSGGGSGGLSSAASVITTSVKQSYFLGGNSTLFVQSPSPDWVAADAVRVTIDTALRGSTTGTVRVRLRAAAGNVTARLRNITDSSTAGTGTLVTAPGLTWADQSFSVTLAAGAKVYELQVLPSIANTDVAAVGYFE